MLELNHDNYFSNEADREYFSVSQFKSFRECEAKTMAKLNGTWVDGENDAFTLGSYVHLWSEGGNLGEFRASHPEMFKKDDSSVSATYDNGGEKRGGGLTNVSTGGDNE